MTTTRPGAAVPSARSPIVDRDEYPALEDVVSASRTTWVVMGPTPRVHLVAAPLPESVVPLPRVRAARPPENSATPFSDERVRPERTLEGDAEEVPFVTGTPTSPSSSSHLPMTVATAVSRQPDAMVIASRTDVGPPEWKPLDPQTARSVLRVEREVEIPQASRRTRRPRSPQLSSGDAAARLRRLDTADRRRRAIILVASVLAVAGLLTAIWRFANLGYAAGETATSWNQVALPDSTLGTRAALATGSATPSTAPTTLPPDLSTGGATAAPIQTMSTARVPSVLRANAIYGSPVTGSCPEQAEPANADDAKAALSAYVDCMNTVWAPIIDDGRILFRPAGIYFYVNTIVNACTTLHTGDPITAMYCPMDATIYVSPKGVDSAVGSRFYGAELVTHEYAHHVQSLSQILTVAVKQGWSENEYSRRVQLQAHCLAFAVLNHVAGFVPEPSIFRADWQVGPGSVTYGSIPSLQYWGERGLAANKVGDCDTYSVPQSAVA